MISTGMTRKVCQFGRIVLPKELRDMLEIGIHDSLEFFIDGSGIVIRKYEPGCILCGEISGTTIFGGQKICNECREEFRL